MQMQNLFGASQFKVHLPELLVLLPDIERQQALLKVHKVRANSENAASSESGNRRGPWNMQVSRCSCGMYHIESDFALQPTQALPGAGEQCGFLVCNTCAQVMTNGDYNYHMAQHTQHLAFPALGL